MARHSGSSVPATRSRCSLEWSRRQRHPPDQSKARASGFQWRGATAIPFAVALAIAPVLSGADWAALSIVPESVSLEGPGASQRIAVTAIDNLGYESDVTVDCSMESSDPRVVAHDAVKGIVIGRSAGEATIHAHCGGLQSQIAVRVGDRRSEMGVSFARDIISILTLKGCNGSSCHGSPAGQNGFKLSLFGQDVAADHEMIVHARDGRRIDLRHPERSLLLQKPTFEIAHGGGRLLTTDSEEYESLLTWLQHGARSDTGGVLLERLELYPRERVLVGESAEQSLIAVGHLSDGHTRDMTGEVRYFTRDDAVARVSADGRVAAADPGLTTVLARALGKVATAQIGVVRARSDDEYSDHRPHNFVDTAVLGKLRQLAVEPGGLTSDREFARRVFLDTIGLLPTTEELRAFLSDPRPDKRALLIDQLLDRPEHASHWTVKFEDWFRNCQLHSQGRSMGVFKDWVRDWLAADRPYDDFVRTLLTSQGDTMLNPGANFWHPATDFMLKEFSVAKVTPTVSRLFLGVRMECAECHSHPLENFTQDDFYGLAAFFSRLRVKHGYGEYRRTWYLSEEGEVEHPATKRRVAPKFLGGEVPKISPGEDRRAVLAEWIVSPDNPYFARATVNRVWYEYFGTGIVEPFDDFRSTNQPSNPELLDRLAEHFVASGFRLRPLHRVIMNSRTYQQTSRDGDAGRLAGTLFARYVPRRLGAESLLDMLGQVTGIAHDFEGYPSGTSAKDIYVPDGPDDFLVTFGLPRRDILQERVGAPTLAQALHLMNGPAVREKVESQGNVIGSLLREGCSDSEIVSSIYERAYSRAPAENELEGLAKFLETESDAGRDRRRALENVLWAVLNSKEFQLNH